MENKIKLFIAGFALSTSVLAADQLKIIVPYAPGGNTDVAARVYAKELVNQGIDAVVVNKPGAEGLIAMQELERLPSDGKTVMVVGNSILYTASAKPQSPIVESLQKIIPVIKILSAGGMLISRQDSDIKTIDQLNSALRVRSVAIGSAGGISGSVINEIWGNNPNLISITYSGDSTILAALLNKSLEVGSVTWLPEDRVESGEFNGLAVTTSRGRRHLKSLVELGYAVSRESWTAVWLPKNTPLSIQEHVYEIFEKARTNSTVQKEIVSIVRANIPKHESTKELITESDELFSNLIKKQTVK
jgi:tripartite-type tricarboxylate transporter receptor subunit TctC